MKAVNETTTVEKDFAFVQPILSANGTMGGDSFACSGDAGSNAYLMFDNNPSTTALTYKSAGGSFYFYNPEPLNVTRLSIQNFASDAWGSRAILTGNVYASDDGASWTLLKSFTNSVSGGSSWWSIDLSTNSNYYKYYRIQGVTTSYADGGAADQVVIAGMLIKATFKGTETFNYSVPKKLSTVFWKYISATFDFVFSGTRSTQGWQSVSQGSNYLYGGSNAYEMGQRAYTQLMWTYTDTIPANTYSFNVYVSGQGNGYFNNPTVVVTYSDNTTETVYTKSWGGSSLNESFTFTASKPIKSIKATGTLTHSSVTYVGINLTLTSLTHLAPIESTEDDYDYTTQKERLCAFK